MATKDKFAMIFEENFSIFKEENDQKITEDNEEELINRIREILPRGLLFKTNLKQYVKRYREGKRPNFSLFEVVLKIMDLNKVFQKIFFSLKKLA
jgi:hypothetical protein